MVSPSDEVALRYAPTEDMEFDAAETEELDKLAETSRSPAYPGKISRQNWAYEAISYPPKTSALLGGLRAPAPSATCLSDATPRKSGRLPGGWRGC